MLNAGNMIVSECADAAALEQLLEAAADAQTPYRILVLGLSREELDTDKFYALLTPLRRVHNGPVLYWSTARNGLCSTGCANSVRRHA